MLNNTVILKRANEFTIDECLALKPTHLVIGPGPGAPSASNLSKQLILKLLANTPILGICLGHQIIGELFGGQIVKASLPVHGKTSLIKHDGLGIYKGIKQSFQATRYHSLIIKEESVPDCLKVTAYSDTGEIMGIRHHCYAIEGIQYHPESILTENGLELLNNFICNFPLSPI